MKHLFKFLTLFVSVQIFSSCCENRIELYHSSYFDKNQNMILIINDGEYKYEKKFDNDYSIDEHTKITDFCNKKDSLKLYFKVDNKDTLFYVPTNAKKVLLLRDLENNLHLYTDKDSDIWTVY